MGHGAENPGSSDTDLQSRLGHRFSDPTLLQMALTHRSHAHEHGTGPDLSYERLELLGDALLGFLVSDWLYRDDPQASEGVLSRRRQSVVRAGVLAGVARELGLGQAIRLGRGEELTGGRDKPSLLADVLEAVLAAVYLDGGLRAARAFVRRHMGGVLRKTRRAVTVSGDFKTLLQELIQADLRRTPHYRTVSTTGPAHALAFEVEVTLDGEVLGRGTGATRKLAEQEAAQRALDRLSKVDREGD